MGQVRGVGATKVEEGIFGNVMLGVLPLLRPRLRQSAPRDRTWRPTLGPSLRQERGQDAEVGAKIAASWGQGVAQIAKRTPDNKYAPQNPMSVWALLPAARP